MTIRARHDVLLVARDGRVRAHVNAEVLRVLKTREDHVVGNAQLLTANELVASLTQMILQLVERSLLSGLRLRDDDVVLLVEVALLSSGRQERTNVRREGRSE